MTRKILPAIGLALLVASTALGAVIVDGFNNGDPSPAWRRTVDTIRVKEQDGKLKFKSDRPGGGTRFSGYKADRWKIDFTKNYNFTMEYKLASVSGLGGSRYAAVGARIFPGGPIDEARVTVRRDNGGLSVVYEAFQNDQRIEFQQMPISAASGELKVRYVASSDRLDISIDDMRVLRLNNLLQGVNTGNDLARIHIGAFRRGAAVQWNWNKVYIERFRYSGTVVD